MAYQKVETGQRTFFESEEEVILYLEGILAGEVISYLSIQKKKRCCLFSTSP